VTNTAKLIGGSIAFKRRERADRINSFYILEGHANNPKVADKTFIIYDGQAWTFRQTYETVLRYAGWLHSTHKVTKGEFVAINMMNSAQMLFTIMAVWSLGAVPALINYNLTGDGFTHSVKSASARVLITEPEIESKTLDEATRAVLLSPTFRNNSFPLEIAVLDEGLLKSLNYFPPYRAPDSVRSGLQGRSPQVLIFTSGTTGLPKPALVTWERTQASSDTVYRWLGLRNVTTANPDRYYTAMPLYHSSGFQLNFHVCLIGACTTVVGRKFSASNFWDDVIRSEATAIQYVGETLRYLLAVPPRPDDRTRHNVRLAFGNGLRADVWERFRGRFGVETIVEFYGATEGVGGTFNYNRNSFSAGAIGSIGSLTNLLMSSMYAFVKVDWDTEEPYRDPKTGFCVKVPTGEPGELLAKLDEKDIGAKFQGYHNNPEATKKKLMRDVFKKGDAYFRTGDVIIKDSEHRQWFSDRIGDTFRWKSENVSTAQVGEVLGHHPKVQEANVYGVSLPGYEGRAGCAAVMLEPSAFEGAGHLKPEVLESLATWCTNSLPKYAVPIFIRTVTELVVTGTNKQQKPKLRQEGVQPDRMGSDKVYWLKPGSATYEPFDARGWSEICGGTAKL
jgi:acyl-CoA synthetase (AMP-forming)/AMP-acid ligase II